MRGRIVLLVVLAVAVALLGVYVGRSTTTPTAIGEPTTTTQADSSLGPTQRRGSGSGPSRTPTPSLPKAPPPKAPPPKAPPPKACSSTAAAQPPAHTKWWDPPPPAADQVHFRQVAITSFDDSAQTSPSPDNQALTTTFDNFTIDVRKSGQCDVTRSLSMTLPVTGPTQAAKVGFYVQGNASADQGANARLTIRANGQVKVKRFPAGFHDSYIHWLEFPVTPGVTYTVSVLLEVHQNPDTGGYATLNMNTIDSSVS